MKLRNKYHEESSRLRDEDMRDEKTADIVAYIIAMILIIGFLSSL